MEFVEVGDYFFKTEKLHDVYFLVGDKKDRIGAVRNQLINQSHVWWTMLAEDSAMVEKNDIHLPDIQPEVFMLLLKHCYGGLNDLSQVATDLVMELCYCANKYLMTELMKKIAKRLEPSSVDELFPALHCLNVYNLSGVENAVEKLVQSETEKILASAQFLECQEDSVAFIARQEPLECDELELWEALITWGKHRARNKEGPELRKMIAAPLQNIRLLSLSQFNLCQHVFIHNVFNSDEIASICKRNLNNTTGLCSNFNLRLRNKSLSIFTVPVINQTNVDGFGLSRESCSALVVKDKNIELKGITFRDGDVFKDFSNYKKSFFSQPTSTVDISVKLTRITNLLNNTSVEEPLVVLLKNFEYPKFDKFSVSTMLNGRGIELRRQSKYKIELSFSNNYIACWNQPNCSEGHEFEHGTFFCSLAYNDGIGLSPCHIMQFEYRVCFSSNEDPTEMLCESK